MPNHFRIGKKVFDKMILKKFPFSCHGKQNSTWNGNLLATFKGNHIKNISLKFGEI